MGNISGARPGMSGGLGGNFDPSQFGDILGKGSSLTLEEYQKYASASSVKDFYYTLTAYFNGSEGFSPVSDETDSSDSSDSLDMEDIPGFPGNMGSIMGGVSSGDFSVIGYSSDSSMVAFINGVASIVEGTI
jgi:putative ABC transport system permease protein